MERPFEHNPQPEDPSWEDLNIEEFKQSFEQERSTREANEDEEDLFNDEHGMKDEGMEINELKRIKQNLLHEAHHKKLAGNEREGEKLLDEAYEIDTKIYNLRRQQGD